MNIVIVGHVDHGKSTVIGRLLADTGSLPDGKLDQVKEMCRRNSRPFEYAFLLDALKDERSQGITIDTARSFFKTEKRDYIIIDAPGHIEFLKNMITGAARAEAALLVIDAREGIQENSKRHGHMVSMLGVRQVSVLVNKMDLVGYDEKVFNEIRDEYSAFLARINVSPTGFIPISAREGHNIASLSKHMPWHTGPTVLKQLDLFECAGDIAGRPFRFPVQDVYKFTRGGDDRRIVAGTVDSGSVSVGDEVIFLPSRKKTFIKSAEVFNAPAKTSARALEAAGFTLMTQIYIRPGDIMAKAVERQPQVGSRFKANIFWVGRAPMIKDKNYKLKLATANAAVRLAEVVQVIDASDLSTIAGKQQVDRHDVAECVLETSKPLAFDAAAENEGTGRFVIVDNYEIAGGGVIVENYTSEDSILKRHVREREGIWEKGLISPERREQRQKHKSKFIVITGGAGVGKRDMAKALEKELFVREYNAYYLGMANIHKGLDADITGDPDERVRRLGELARIMTDAGMIFITTVDDADDYDVEKLKFLNEPHEILVINVGENNFDRYPVDLEIPARKNPEAAVSGILKLLKAKDIILEYYL